MGGKADTHPPGITGGRRRDRVLNSPELIPARSRPITSRPCLVTKHCSG
jgi:hypothetical protein